MPDFNENLWAPWRMEYIRSIEEDAGEGGCFLCRYWRSPSDDAAHHVVWRREHAFVVMNRFPYTNGHLMIAYAHHVGEISDVPVDHLTELMTLIRDANRLLGRVVSAQGFNVGFNVGHCAGAGLPGHLHAHVVPRWGGDTNFMAVLGKTRVIPDALDTLHKELVAGARDMGFTQTAS